MTFVVNNVLLLIIIARAFEFHRFINIKHKEIEKFNKKTRKTIDVIVASNNFFNKSFFDNRSIKKNRFIFVDLIEFFVEWNIDIFLFRRTFQNFRKHIVVYRKSTTFQNFLKFWSISSTNENNQSKTSKSTTSNSNKFRQKSDSTFKIRLFKREFRVFSYSFFTQKNIEIDFLSIQAFLIKSLVIEIDFSFVESNTLSSIIFIDSFENSNIINNNSQLSFLNARILTNVFRSIIFRFFAFDVININNLKNQSSSNDFIS